MNRIFQATVPPPPPFVFGATLCRACRGAVLAAAAAGFVCAVGFESAHATTIIYSEIFSGSGSTDLNGQAPQIRPGTETWNASPVFKANGTAALNADPATGENSSFLPFAPIVGQVYTLSASLAQPLANPPPDSQDWWGAIAFTSGSNVNTSVGKDPNFASPWMLYRASGIVRTFTGTGGTGGEDEGTFSGTQTLSITLDTTAAQWQAEWKVGSSTVRTQSFTTNPTINYVAFGRAQAGVDFDSFALVVVPEPGTLPLAGLGVAAAALVVRRRGLGNSSR